MRSIDAVVALALVREVLVRVVHNEPRARRFTQCRCPLQLGFGQQHTCTANTVPSCTVCVVPSSCVMESRARRDGRWGSAPVGLQGFTSTTILGGLPLLSSAASHSRSGCQLAGSQGPNLTASAPPVICSACAAAQHSPPSLLHNGRCTVELQLSISA